ncbi:VWA domain-containing protein [Marinoscillum sp. MHG1-6]|uniref:vWA domain-containing protein n=1 Tax=Marinoscillum sp. MHG1-6 TaxID=2959627 RepID=UPI002157BE00|nr:VWA domain-containing protein [Marinoscillum sp. MHG1-6]
MNWSYDIGTFELIITGLFILFYLLYVIRMVRISNKTGLPVHRIILKLILRTSYFALLVIALLGPSFGQASREIKSVGKDMFICVDLSQSMNAFDIQPTRLEKVKFELKKIVEAFNSDRIGLIMFSNEAFMQCPLTYDNNALNIFIQALNTTLVPNTGTDFGPPLKMALNKLQNEEDGPQSNKSKIIILISDGEDFGEETEQISEEIEATGIKLFTLGVGTDKGSKIMTNRGYKRDHQGKDVVSKINTDELKKLASDTGGKYFEINDRKNDVERLINAINNIEGQLRDAKKVDVKSNKYFYFLAAALFLMMIDLLFGVRIIKI